LDVWWNYSIREIVLMFAPLAFSVLLAIASTQREPTLQQAHHKIIKNWLKSHPGYRLATEQDCGDCMEQIQSIRRGMGGPWKPVSNYSPYYMVGDFNGDGKKDFAVAVIIPSHTPKKFILLIFNGPFNKSEAQNPVFISEPLDLMEQGLFYGPPRPKPFRLLVGGFESEGTKLVPKGKGYAWSHSSHEE
jgi:hypothetical protein